MKVIASFFRFLLLAVIVLHFSGAAQCLSSCIKDKTAFVNMLNMTEEESKKEKDDNSEGDFKINTGLYNHQLTNLFYHESNFGFVLANDETAYQFIGEVQSPPPDSRA